MAQPIAHLPLEVRLSTQLNGEETTLDTVTVKVPITVDGGSGGYVRLALDADELAALIRRASNALDAGTRDED